MNYYYDEPTDERAAFNRRVVYTEDMVFSEHAPGMPYDMTREQVIADWLICCWASPTDMPAGEYITKACYPLHIHEPCGYCGRSLNPNDICKPCYDNLATHKADHDRKEI